MIFFRYVLRSYFINALMILSVCLFLFVLFDYIQRSQRYFSRYESAWESIAQYYLFQMPSIMFQVLPIVALIASIITVIILARTNEITAVRAASGDLVTLATPLLFGGAVIGVALVIISELVLPYSSAKFNQVARIKIEKKESVPQSFHKTWLKDDNKNIYNYSYFNAIEKRIYDLRIDTLHPNSFVLTRTIRAKTADLNAGIDEKAVLKNVEIINFDSSGKITDLIKQEELLFAMPFSYQNIQTERTKVSDFGVVELSGIIKQSRKSGLSISDLQFEMHNKISLCILIMLVSLIGLRFAYHFERNNDVVFGVLIAVFIGMSYWIILSTTKALAYQSLLTPALAAWIPVLVLALMVNIDLYFASRKS